MFASVPPLGTSRPNIEDGEGFLVPPFLGHLSETMGWTALLGALIASASDTGHTGVEDRFLRWLQDEGGEAMRTKHLRFAEFSGSGRGLQALEPLAAGEPIVSVPRHLHMTSHDAWETFGAAGIDLGGVRPTGCEALAMLLMREAGDGLAGLPGGGGGGSGGSSSSSAEKAAAAAAAAGGAARGGTGRWAPYVATLPRPSSMSGDARSACALPQVPALLLKAMAEADHHRTASAEAAKVAASSAASSASSALGGGGAAASGTVGLLGADVAAAAAQGNALFSVLEKSPTTRNVLAHRLQRFEARAAELEDRLWRHHPPAAFGLGGEGGGGGSSSSSSSGSSSSSSATSADAAGGSAAADDYEPAEPAPWEVELVKPAPERRQALWRWASAMVTSRAWRGEIGSDGGAWGAWQHKTTTAKGQRKTADGGVGCSLVPLADMLNHKAGAGALQFKQQQQQQQKKKNAAGEPAKAASAAGGVGVAQVLAVRPYRAGEQLHDSYVAQANATAEPECNVYLFYNFGFVEGNSGGSGSGEATTTAAAAAAAARDCAFVDLAIPEKLLEDGRARRVLAAHGFLAPGAENGGAREKFTLRGGGGLPVRLLQLMRLLAASEDEMAVEDARAEAAAAAPQPLAPQQLSVTNELRVLRQIERALDGFLEGFGDSAKADAAAAAHALAAAREVQPASDSDDYSAAQAAQGTLLARATALHLRAGEQRALRRAADGLAEHWSRLYWQAGVSYVLVPSATLLVGAVVMKLTQG